MVAASTAPPAGPRIYTELPDGLITIGDASRKYGCPMTSMCDWISQGRLRDIGRLKAPARGGYMLVSEDELQRCLRVRRKPGRSRKVA